MMSASRTCRGVGCHRDDPTIYAAINVRIGICARYREKEPRARNRIARTARVLGAMEVADINIQSSAKVAIANRKSKAMSAR